MIVKKDKTFFQDYLTDTSNLAGSAEILFIPETEEEIQQVLKHAISQKMPLTISSARTGNVGGAVPSEGAILSLERLNKIILFHHEKKRIEVQAGVPLQEIEDTVSLKNLSLMSYPTEKSACAGGAVSTCCSGLRSFKYGSIRDAVKRIKIVLSSGETLDIERGKYFAKGRAFDLLVGETRVQCSLPTYALPTQKSQAGYYVQDNMDLIDLFIGSEGTLGVIVACGFYLKPLPENYFDGLLFFDSEEDALKVCRDLQLNNKEKNLELCCLEFFDEHALRLIKKDYDNLIGNNKAALYFEEEIYTPASEADILSFWDTIFQKYHLDPHRCYFGKSKKQKEFLYTFRHKVPETINQILRSRKQRKLSTDCAVPEARFNEMYHFYKEKGNTSEIEYVLFGHIGESHLHFNFLPKTDKEYAKAQGIIEEIVKEAIRLGGTFSAEHGVGKTRKQYMPLLFTAEHIQQMKTLKAYFDPHNILGIGNIF